MHAKRYALSGYCDGVVRVIETVFFQPFVSLNVRGLDASKGFVAWLPEPARFQKFAAHLVSRTRLPGFLTMNFS